MTLFYPNTNFTPANYLLLSYLFIELLSGFKDNE
jgi:hypothetical protein